MSSHRIYQASFSEGCSDIVDEIELTRDLTNALDKICCARESSFRKNVRLSFTQADFVHSLIRLQHTKPINSGVNSYD